MSNAKKLYVEAANSQSSTHGLRSNKVKNIFNKPLVQFVILGLVFIVIQLLGRGGILPSKYVTVAATVMIYTIVCEGFCLLLGYAGLASLGSACFVGIGAYSIFFIMQQWGLPYILAISMALGISLLLGLAIGFISLRVQGLFLGIITLGLSEIIRNVLREIWSQTILLRTAKMKLFGMSVTKTEMYIVIAIIMVICLLILYNLMHSPTGRNMVAMKNSTSAAQAFGINLLIYRVLAFIIACMLAALTGVCYISYGYSINPSTAGAGDPALAITLSLNVLAAVIIGGYKSLWGTFAGVVFVFGLTSLFSALFPTLANDAAAYISLVVGVLMIIIVMFYPGGFYQLFYTLKYKIKESKMKRKVRIYGIQ